MAMNLEMYDNLKGEIGERAARVIAEAIPPGRELATRSDVASATAALRSDIEAFRAALRSDIEAFRVELRSDIEASRAELRSETQLAVAHLEGRIDRQGADLMRWMLTFFVPLWLGVYGTLAAVVVTLLARG